jgi:Rod binding domain-containing protein
MSSLAPLTVSSTGLPTVDEAHAPAAVRNGSASVKQAYASAQGFEEMLLQQLSSSLVQSSGLSGEGAGSGEGSGEEGSSEAGGEAGGGMLSSLLPQTLTEGVMRAGGLGLAGQLLHSLDPSASAAAPTGASVSGGASAPAGAASAPAPAAASNGTVAAPSPTAAMHTGGASA